MIAAHYVFGRQSFCRLPTTIRFPVFTHDDTNKRSNFTCVSDAALLALLPRLVDDAHPHQRRHHDACHHGDDYDPYRDGARPHLRYAGAAASGHHKLAVSALCSQGVGHEAGVASGILQRGRADDQKLVPRGEVVSVGGSQRLVVAQPGDAGRRAAEGLALQGHGVPDHHAAVFQVLGQVGCFCGGEE